MRVAGFFLLNEKGQTYSLMNEINYCLLIQVSGLGYSYSTEYVQSGNTFISTLRKVEQGLINGEARFRNYDNFKQFVDFIETSEKLRFLYTIPLENGQRLEYFKDVSIKNISKESILDLEEDKKITSSIVFDCLTLWYQDEETTYTISEMEEEVQWNFRWDARFSDYTSRSIVFDNNGHIEAPLQLEMCNYLINPGFYILKDGKVINELKFPITLQKGEKILYSSKDNELFIRKQNANGSYESLFKQKYIDLNKNNIFRIPKGMCEITLFADNNIYDAKLNIFKQYKVV